MGKQTLLHNIPLKQLMICNIEALRFQFNTCSSIINDFKHNNTTEPPLIKMKIKDGESLLTVLSGILLLSFNGKIFNFKIA